MPPPGPHLFAPLPLGRHPSSCLPTLPTPSLSCFLSLRFPSFVRFPLLFLLSLCVLLFLPHLCALLLRQPIPPLRSVKCLGPPLGVVPTSLSHSPQGLFLLPGECVRPRFWPGVLCEEDYLEPEELCGGRGRCHWSSASAPCPHSLAGRKLLRLGTR